MLHRILMDEAPSDGGGGSSTATAQPAASPPAQPQTGSGAQTLADVITSTAAASLAEGTGGQDGSGASPDGDDLIPAQPPKEEPGQAQPQVTEPAKEGTTEPPAKTETDDYITKLPLHMQPRFKEVYEKSKQRDEFEAKVRDYESRATQQEPLVKAQLSTNQYCREHGITQKQFVELLNTQALINENPQAAFVKLKPVYEQLAALNGQAPTLDADLQDMVTKGEIGMPQAQGWQKDRALNKFQEGRQRLTAEQMQAQQDFAIEQALTQWDMDMRGKDTAFKPRVSETLPKGKYELVSDFLTVAWQRQKPSTSLDAIKLVQQAYTDANALIAQFQPKPAPSGKSLPPNGSSAATRFEPKSLQDVVFGVADGSYQYQR